MEEAAPFCLVRPDCSRIRTGLPVWRAAYPEKLGQMMPLLPGITAFKGVSAMHLERLVRGGRLSEALHGTQVLVQGDPADAVYAIVAGEGNVRIEWTDRRSKRLMVHILRRGDMFGELAVLNRSTRSASATVEGRVELLRISAQVFLDVLSESAELSANVCRLLARRLRRTFELCQDSTFQSLEARFARQLLYLAEAEGRWTDHGLRLPGRFRQADLADLVGVTTRSIINLLNKWRAEGLVKYDAGAAQLTICRVPELRRLLEA